MDQGTKSRSGIGAGLELSANGIRLTLAQTRDIAHTVVEAELPEFYVPDDGLARPADITDWLAPNRLSYADDRGSRYYINASEYLSRVIESVFSAAKKIFGKPIDLICAGAAHSYSERVRFRLKDIISRPDVEVQLFNQDLAVLETDRELLRENSLLIYILGDRSIEISWYQTSQDVLKLDKVEVIENCGWDILTINILKILLQKTSRLKITTHQFPILFKEGRNSIAKWNQEEALSIRREPMQAGPDFLPISASKVKEIIQDTFGPSFSTARHMVSNNHGLPAAVIMSTQPCNAFVLNCLQQSLGFSVQTIDYNKFRNGLAFKAWKVKGMPDLQLPAEQKLPVIIQPRLDAYTGSGRDRFSGNAYGKDRGRSTSKKFMDQHRRGGRPIPPPKTLSGKVEQQAAADEIESGRLLPTEGVSSAEIIAEMKIFYNQIFAKISILRLKDMQEFLQGMEPILAKFIVNVNMQFAERHIDRHEFEIAYKIYESTWKNEKSQQLFTKAIGLAIDRAKSAIRNERFQDAKDWCQKGLLLDKNNQDLKEIQNYLNPRLKKKRALRNKKKKRKKKR